MQDMVTNFIENVQGFLSQCRDLENQHHEKLLEMSIVTLEKVIKNELDEEITEDLRMVSWKLFQAASAKRTRSCIFYRFTSFWKPGQKLI